MEKKFKTFDRVLLRQGDGVWKADFYSHPMATINRHKMVSSRTVEIDNIIPYEGNEHLVGTTEAPETEVRLEEGEIIICSDYLNRLSTGTGILERYKAINGFSFHTHDGVYEFAIRFKDFDPSNMEETKKHILCVKNGKIIKYRKGND